MHELDSIRQAAIRAWREDGPLASRADDFTRREELAAFPASLELAYRVGWDMELELVSLSQLDRQRPMLNGPLLTTAKAPWPVGRDGRYLVPIVQVDLDVAGALSGQDLGGGLAQLWQDRNTMVTRVVQHDEVGPIDEAWIPVFQAGFNLDDLEFFGGHHGLPRFLSGPRQVTGYAGPYLFGPMRLDDFLDDLLAGAAVSEALASALRALRHAVREGREQYRQANRLFGSFDGINEHPEQHPPALFSSDDDEVLNVGDLGTVAMYCERTGDGVRLEGTFDCF